MNSTPHPLGEIAASIIQNGGQRLHLRPSHAASRAPTGGATEMVRTALTGPLDFPALSAAVVPGDRVAIAVGKDIPSVSEIVRGAVESFEHAGIDTEAIAIVTADAATLSRCRELLQDRGDNLPSFVVHDPNDKENLCLVGLNKRKQPLVVNRTIFDADVVLPIGCARAEGSAYDCLFPDFSSAEAIEQYRTPANLDSEVHVQKLTKEATEAGWLIGTLMILQVVPGPDESVAHVVAGEPDAVNERCRDLYRESWSRTSPHQTTLVVAGVSGGPDAQTWQNVGRALAAAAPLLDSGGAVALCTNVSQSPGQSLSRLINCADLPAITRKISHDHGDDSLAAWQLAKALERGPVYLLSQLDEESVEDLGIAPIESVADLLRLAERHDHCTVIDDAQRAIVAIG